MTKAWTYLLTATGTEISTPKSAQLTEAIAVVYQEPLPGTTAADAIDRGGIALRSGHDQGPMYVLSIARGGLATWEEWANKEYEAELCPAREQELSEQQAFKLMSQILLGNIDRVRSAFADAVEK